MEKNTVNISPLIENQKVEIRVDDIINDTEVLTFHKYSLDGEKYRIIIPLFPSDEPKVICEVGHKKIIKKVKNEVKKTISGDKQKNFAIELKMALEKLGIENTAYGVFCQVLDSISNFFGITPDKDESPCKKDDFYCRFFNHKKYYLEIVKEKGLFVLIICANIGLLKKN